jgi:predicted PurR-regulated permease PerM
VTQRRQLAYWLLALGVLFLMLWLLRGILLPFVVGVGVAYLLDPLADRLEKRGLSRTLATALIILAFFAVVIGLILVLAPIVYAQFFGFIERVPEYLAAGRLWLEPIIERVLDVLGISEREAFSTAVGSYGERAVGWGAEVLAGLVSGGAALFNLAALILVTPLVAFYLLRDWNRILARIDSWLPRHYAPIVRNQVRDIDRVVAGFVRGQAMVALVLGTFYGVGLSLIGLDFGLAIGIVTGFLTFIPIIGQAVGFAVSLGLGLYQFWPEWLMLVGIVGLFGAGQILESNWLIPWLIGPRVGLHPAWVIFALLAGGALFGFVGLLLAVPVFASIAVLVRYALSRYLKSPLYHGGHPPAEPPP